jgi:hypothetical protein
VKEYRNLRFPNTRAGQSQKIAAIKKLANQGWVVTSETIESGKFKGGNACCLFVVCPPLAFCAGSTNGFINVVLERET